MYLAPLEGVVRLVKTQTGTGTQLDQEEIWKTGLPVDELVILMPVEISPAAVAVHTEGTLLKPADLPRQVFTARDFIASGRTSPATPHDLARLKLTEVFEPDRDAEIVSIPLAPDDPVRGFLLCKVKPDQSASKIRTMCHRRSDFLRTFIRKSRPLIERLERDLLLAEHQVQLPAVVIDSKLWIAAANGAFCELVGRSRSDLVCQSLFDILRLECSLPAVIPAYPETMTLTSSIYVRTQSLFFVSEIRLSRLMTICGPHTLCVFQDLLTHQRTGNSNIQLAQKLSSLLTDDEHPNTVIRRIINVLSATLNCDLVCVLRRKGEDEMLVTPHANRSMDSLRANLVSRKRDLVLEPFFSQGSPVWCSDVAKHCPDDGFFGQVQRVAQFAFIPAGQGVTPDFALLMAWSEPDEGIGPKTMPLLRIAANLLGSVLLRAKLVSEMDQEKEILRRYTKLTAGREVRMADLKRENAGLRELVMKLGDQRSLSPEKKE